MYSVYWYITHHIGQKCIWALSGGLHISSESFIICELPKTKHIAFNKGWFHPPYKIRIDGHPVQSPGTRKFKYMYWIWVTDIIVQWCRGNPSVVALVVIRMRYLFRVYTRQRITTRAGTEAGPYHVFIPGRARDEKNLMVPWSGLPSAR